MTRAAILLVEDDKELCDALCETLGMAGYTVAKAHNGQQALEQMDSGDFNLVVSDVQMDIMDGHALLRHLKRNHAEIPVILMTAYGTIQKAVEAMREGAVDYMVKPFEAEVLANTVAKYIPQREEEGAELIAADPATLQKVEIVRRVSDSDATVLITGESGSGKEVFAREIHRLSPRHNGPFVAINCAAIPENMLEAMLFGYEKGSFTGAYKASPGKFEMANGGTILLDEISEMDFGLQAKLLRVLQEREVERLGGNKMIALDVRVLATSNRNMRDEVDKGKFREDLYYRLNVFPLHLPPLRDRMHDIIPLATHLLNRHFRGNGKPLPAISSSAQQKLVNYSWPGNIRELDNVIQRALILHQGGAIEIDDIIFEGQSGENYDEEIHTGSSNIVRENSATLVSNSTADQADNPKLNESLKSREQRLILDALREGSGSRKFAAEKLGISQRTLRYKLARMRESGVNVPASRGD
ncbi:MAG: sigma-54 dependent transcriptional regulator [Pseudomonadota bacterium]